MSSLYAIPPAVLLVLAVAVAAGVACAGQTLLHRRFGEEDFVTHNEVAGFIIAVVGALYAVVLGFMTVVVWQEYGATNDRVALENAAVTDVWHSAVGFPAPARSRLRSDMLQYAQTMIDREWPLMRDGGFTPRGDELIMDATVAGGTFIPANLAQANAQAEALRLLAALHDARQRRLASNHQQISGFEWAVLTIGAFVVVGFCWLFGMPNRRIHLIMTGAVATIVATMFTLIFELQSPFRGELGITSAPWSATVAHMRLMDASPSSPMKM